MKSKSLFAALSLALIASIVFTSIAFAWSGGVNSSGSCEGVTVTANPEDPYWEDHSGMSQVKWIPISTTGTGFFPWNGSNHQSGSVNVTWKKYTSNNFGVTWTATSATHSESYSWSKNLSNDCKKIWVCHVPEGNPLNKQAIEISQNAWTNGSVGGHKAGAHGGDFGPISGPNDPSCQPPPPVCTYTTAVDGPWSDYEVNPNDPASLIRHKVVTYYDATETTHVCDTQIVYDDPITRPLCQWSTATYADEQACQPPPPVLGCTDDTATNYNPLATQDDGTCTFPPPPVYGCTDSTATNYNALATVDDGSCTYAPPPVLGCTDNTATNYNPQATQDDGSCTYTEEPTYCTDETANNVGQPLPCTYDQTPTEDPDPGGRSLNEFCTTHPQAVTFCEEHGFWKAGAENPLEIWVINTITWFESLFK